MPTNIAETGESIDCLRAHVRYEPESGWFFSMRSGRRVGAVHDKAKGYIVISTGRNGRCRAHRAAFALMTGAWPIAFVDHIDGDPANNAWENLRQCGHSENMHNRRLQRNNSSGYVGAHWHTKAKRWVSKIRIDGRVVHIGCFDTPELAAIAYAKTAIHSRGEFVPAHVIATASALAGYDLLAHKRTIEPGNLALFA